MKNLIFLSFFAIMLFSNCQQEETIDTPEMVQATITMPNPMMCPTICCSGWFIEIDGENYHFVDFPEGSEFDGTDIEGYPVEVQLTYELSDDCWDNSIEVLEIEEI